VNRREEEPGYTNYKRLKSGEITYRIGTLMLTYMPIDQTALTSVLNHATYRNQAIATILDTVAETGAQGVNIDFEPLGDVSPTLRDNFTLFIQELKNSSCLPLHTDHCPLITVSIYPSAGVKPRLWDLAALAPVTDYFVVMTYDYTLPGSSSAGPNAPLRDSTHLFEHTVVGNIAELTKLVSARKILLGIPLYGYEWTTRSTKKYSPTDERGVTASLERIEKMILEQTLTTYWDRNTLTPYGVTGNGKAITQIYFENATSLSLKLELVKSAHLGGIALWALGYENNVPWLWPTIRQGL
jgi:spore germination protein YaaH